jgi:hypothetical protein
MPPVREADNRPSANKRGYGTEWNRIRQQVLDASMIPRNEQHLYDVDHTPCYDPVIQPDHWQYALTPRLHAEHTRITNRQKKKGETRKWK